MHLVLRIVTMTALLVASGPSRLRLSSGLGALGKRRVSKSPGHGLD